MIYLYELEKESSHMCPCHHRYSVLILIWKLCDCRYFTISWTSKESYFWPCDSLTISCGPVMVNSYSAIFNWFIRVTGVLCGTHCKSCPASLGKSTMSYSDASHEHRLDVGDGNTIFMLSLLYTLSSLSITSSEMNNLKFANHVG